MVKKETPEPFTPQETVTTYQEAQSQREKRPSRLQKFNVPPVSGVYEYLKNRLPPSHLESRGLSAEGLASTLPKRYTIYQPLVLLSPKVFTSTPEWQSLYASLDTGQRRDLYASIVKSFGRNGVTHLATNGPIAQTDSAGAENRMRSPTNLVPLYGDFGKLPPATSGTTQSEDEKRQPTESELNAAFWVRTKQNGGVIQIWAPLYTMFSRGNVVEKARIMGLDERRFDGLDESLGGPLAEMGVVDMYAGIGYFAFSFLKRGIGRVWGWEINGWSIEGLCSGCRENGWGVKVVKVNVNGDVEGGLGASIDGLREEDRIVVFHGDNRFAGDVILRIKSELEKKGQWKRVRHVNLGLLPTSMPSWENAVRVLDPDVLGWIHVHENTDVNEIDTKKDQVVKEMDMLASKHHGGSQLPQNPNVECIHIEQVKGYAPKVMHCVFDISISPTPPPLVEDEKDSEKRKSIEYS